MNILKYIKVYNKNKMISTKQKNKYQYKNKSKNKKFKKKLVTCQKNS